MRISLSHTKILIQELNQHGHVTYRELVERYGNRGYTYSCFVASAKQLRDKGKIRGPCGKDGMIVKASTCPCCGRPL